MNPLDSFTVERLEELISDRRICVDGWVRDLAKIALAAKRAKAVAIAISPDLASAYLGNALVVGQKLYTTLPAPQIPDGWIKCSERMPECSEFDHVAVMVSEGRNSFQAFFSIYYRKFLFEPYGDSVGNKVTHWMPLPAAPKPD